LDTPVAARWPRGGRATRASATSAGKSNRHRARADWWQAASQLEIIGSALLRFLHSHYIVKPVEYDKFSAVLGQLGLFLKIVLVPQINGVR
jgi:hypothetical protein